MAVDTTYYKYHLVSREDIVAKIKCLHGSNVVDNGDKLKLDNKRSYFSFFMPTDEGRKLVAHLISIEGRGNIFIDLISEKRFADDEGLIPLVDYILGNDQNGVECLKLHKTISQTKGEDFEKRVGKYYEHLGYEVIYHGFEKGLKDGGIDLIVKKLGEKTKYIQCKNLKKQIDYDKIAGIYGRVVDELKFNVEFVIWANNGFDYGANKFAESKGIVLMSGGDLIGVEEEDLVCSIKDNKHVHLANDDIIKDKMKRQKNADGYYDIINEEGDTVHFTDNYWDSAYDIIKHGKFSNSGLCIVYFYGATYDADTGYRTTHGFRIITTKGKCFADVGEISDIDLSGTQYEDDEDSFIQSMLEEQIEFIDGIAIVQTTTGFNILNEKGDFILPINYDNIYKENDYYIACNNDGDDGIQDEKCFTIDSNGNIKTINNSPA